MNFLEGLDQRSK